MYNFTSQPLHFSGMDSEPGSRSMNVSLWGYRTDFSKWEVITIDFGKLLHSDCEYVVGGKIPCISGVTLYSFQKEKKKK